MPFVELKEGLRGCACKQVRTDSETHFEAVLVAEHLGGVSQRLADFFGSPVWPSREKLSREIEREVQPFGGIRSGQTLYYHAT
jgi:hypothetical protein